MVNLVLENPGQVQLRLGALFAKLNQFLVRIVLLVLVQINFASFGPSSQIMPLAAKQMKKSPRKFSDSIVP